MALSYGSTNAPCFDLTKEGYITILKCSNTASVMTDTEYRNYVSFCTPSSGNPSILLFDKQKTVLGSSSRTALVFDELENSPATMLQLHTSEVLIRSCIEPEAVFPIYLKSGKLTLIQLQTPTPSQLPLSQFLSAVTSFPLHLFFYLCRSLPSHFSSTIAHTARTPWTFSRFLLKGPALYRGIGRAFLAGRGCMGLTMGTWGGMPTTTEEGCGLGWQERALGLIGSPLE